MTTKTKILIGVFVIGLVLIGGWWVWNNLSQETARPVIQKNQVTIITDKAEYKQGEKIKFTICNGLSEKLYGTPTIFGLGLRLEKSLPNPHIPTNSRLNNKSFRVCSEDSSWSEFNLAGGPAKGGIGPAKY